MKPKTINRNFVLPEIHDIADTPRPKTTIAEFKDNKGNVIKKMDLPAMGFPRQIAEAFAEALPAHYAGSPISTCEGLKTISPFAEFLSLSDITRSEEITTAIIGSYIHFLDQRRSTTGPRRGQLLTVATKGTHYYPVKQALKWIQRYRPLLLPDDLHFPENPWPNAESDLNRVAPLKVDHLKAIAVACKKDIDSLYNSTFRKGREILSAIPDVIPAYDGTLETLIWNVHSINNGVIPSEEQTIRHFRNHYYRHFHLSEVAPFLHMTTLALLPFYVLMMIETAGNPYSILQMTTDCCRPNPTLLDEPSSKIVWHKGRSSSEQFRVFYDYPKYSPKRLVEMIREMTAPIRQLVSTEDRDKLFITYIHNHNFGINGELDKQPLATFIKRHGLEKFTFQQLRKTNNNAHYLRDGDVLKAQNRLGHKNAATTYQYLQNPIIAAKHERLIARDLNTWLEELKGRLTNAESDIGFDTSNVHMVHGICKDPTDTGEICVNLDGALTSANLIILLEPRNLALVLSEIERMEEGRPHIDPRRWNALYAPRYRWLKEDILPEFPESLYQEAEHIKAGYPPKERLL